MTVYEGMATPGRKLLMAGRGGLNLTHSEPRPGFDGRYGEAAALVAGWLDRWPPEALRAWAEGLGIATFVGSSGRVFPVGLKASPLLRAWLARLTDMGVALKLRHRWVGFAGPRRLQFQRADGVLVTDEAGATVLALGGASWPRLGADGSWAVLLAAAGVAVRPFRPANAGAVLDWSAPVAVRAGTPLKTIALTVDGQRVAGELMITATGLEGGPVYALGPALRRALDSGRLAVAHLDLKPGLTLDQVRARLSRPPGSASLSTWLRRSLGLAPAAVALLRQAGPPALRADPAAAADAVKALPLVIRAMAPLERAISSAGGIALDAVDQHLMLRRLPGVFVAGEMLDWEAPTGGYLLQACFSSAKVAADGAAAWLAARPAHD